MRITRICQSLLLSTLLVLIAACGDNMDPEIPEPTGPGTIQLRLLETTDIHVHLADYDYYQDAPSDTVGLANVATLIAEARGEVNNSMLVDNGDLIQGNPLGDYMARELGLDMGEVHPVYKAMNLLDYEVGNIGNHEFNYGLDFLDAAVAGASFPYISANVFIDDGDQEPDNDEPYFAPYVIKEKTFVDDEGEQQTLKVGFIGFVPPQIMIWDRTNLTGEVIAKDMVEAAMTYVPMMKAEGADLIIAIPHSGLNASDAEGLDENAVYYLAAVPDIDAIMFGHSHRVFPSSDYEGIVDVDLDAGTVRGVPAVMAGYWGSHLGIIDLTLEQVDGAWTVTDAHSETRAISMRMDGQTVALVDPDQDLLDAIDTEHQGTLTWIREPIGSVSAPIHSFFARVQDDPSVQIVTDAQKAYVEELIVGTEHADLPVLSAGAPFKAGFGGPQNYTNVAAGSVSYRNMADLYIYPNTLQVVKIKGAEVREWLEHAAGAFNQIDPNSTDPQPLLNDSFPSYNFDVIDGVTYQIDLTQPARYDRDGNVVEPDAHRIQDLRFQDQPIDEAAEFLVATNNYRAGGGGNFPGLGGDKTVILAPDENRQILANYIAEQSPVNPSADDNWSFVPINDTVIVTFVTSPDASAFAEDFDLLIRLGTTNADGYDEYHYDFSPPPPN
ncbi:bifunctional 2',3'-cyclic-nucleotide 2'-phosphodiesterase/3'-nucleotidase [Haliangium sp.]|uniref:bifunctional 2',3'-cyclic-nucleotide 2'-phosphodiesterase/3'-nucleotidase n=1 Tax=Haliangium sp. TaxID=2663208 RepID=UPI003D0F7EEA